MSNSEESKSPLSREQALAKLKESLADELDRLFDEAIIGAPKAHRTKSQDQNPPIEIHNYGKLSSLVMPVGWIEDKPESGETDSRRCREFHPQVNKSVRLVFFFRGTRASPEAAEQFRLVLSKRAHVLSPAELKKLGEILRDKAEPERFKIMVAATRELNGSRVLVVEGSYLDTNNKREAYAMFIDGDGSGSIVQEISFLAPKREYPSFFADATSSFKSIQWK